METLNNIVLTIQHYLADYILIVALLGGGVWFSIRLGFIQERRGGSRRDVLVPGAGDGDRGSGRDR